MSNNRNVIEKIQQSGYTIVEAENEMLENLPTNIANEDIQIENNEVEYDIVLEKIKEIEEQKKKE